MPNFCIFEDKLISTEDVYKFNIDKNSESMCYTCDKRLHFRQSRNADKGYTEHFYHQGFKSPSMAKFGIPNSKKSYR